MPLPFSDTAGLCHGLLTASTVVIFVADNETCWKQLGIHAQRAPAFKLEGLACARPGVWATPQAGPSPSS